MSTNPKSPADAWSLRWGQLARAAGVGPGERLLVALSGGADSVFLLHLVAAARPRPPVRALHVHHGLRGPSADADEAFSRALCHSLDVPYACERVELDPSAPSLEARAREARYRALCAEARRTGHTTLLTGHHADDALETLLLRWLRGTHLAGLAGLRPRVELPAGEGFDVGGERGAEPLALVRPLLTLRREEVRRLLTDRGLTWREDESNGSRRHTRNRVRRELLPSLADACGEEAVENLRAFARAVEALEERLAGATAHLFWRPGAWATASRPGCDAALGGSLERAELMRLSPTLRRRALWRLIVEGTGHAPGRSLLSRLLTDLGSGRCARHTLPGSWSLVLRSGELWLLPPEERAGPQPLADPGVHQPALPFPSEAREPRPVGLDLSPFGTSDRPTLALPVPGIVTLPDGRRLSAELLPARPGAPVPRSRREVELDCSGLLPGGAELPVDGSGAVLEVRWPVPGDRFQGIGAPGAKSLLRFLADAGVPREERRRVPLVCAGGEILWVAGVRPAERRRVGPATASRLRLALHDASWERAGWERAGGERAGAEGEAPGGRSGRRPAGAAPLREGPGDTRERA